MVLKISSKHKTSS